MTRDFLKEHGVPEEHIKPILDEHSRGVLAQKNRAETLSAEVAGLKTQLENRDAEHSALKKAAAGNEELQKQLDALKTEHEKATADHKSQMQALRVKSAIVSALAGKAHDASLVSTLLDTSKIELTDDGTIKAGLDEQLSMLQKEKAFLFVDSDRKLSGFKPKDGATADELAESGKGEPLGALLGKKAADAAKLAAKNPYFD